MVTELIDQALGASIDSHLEHAIPATLDLTAKVMERSKALPQPRSIHARRQERDAQARRWRRLTSPFLARAVLRPRLLEAGIFVVTAAVLIAVLTTGGGLLSRSHPNAPLTTDPSSAPVSITTAAASAPAPPLTCVRQRSSSTGFGTRLDPPGPAIPRVSCAQILVPLHCPWHADSDRGPCFQGVPPTIELLRVTTSDLVSETTSASPSFKARNLLAWQVTWVPKVCTAFHGDKEYWATAFAPVPFPVTGIYFPASPCNHTALRYYIDATTDKLIEGSIW